MPDPDIAAVADFAPRLLAWYDHAARNLPWRIAPGSAVTPDPYRIWLAEVMLQQTTVAAVAGYFARFTERWPSVADLAAADDADVMAAWAGLGYYARARNLLACARAVVADHDGLFPDSETGLRALPGVGDYTAAAVAAIAFGRHAAAGRKARDPCRAGAARSARSPRRLRAGSHGSGRNDLHAAQPRLHPLSRRRRLRRICGWHRRVIAGQAAQKGEAAAPRTRLVDRIGCAAVAGTAPR
jgi:hypothetical protein